MKKVSVQMMKNLQTPENIELAKAVFTAMAWVQTVRPVVLGYQTKILAEHEYMNDRANEKDSPAYERFRILNPEHTYMMNEKDFAEYLYLCDMEAAKVGLTHKEGCCPLLEAEDMLREAQHLFAKQILKAIPQYKGVALDDLLRYETDKEGKLKKDENGKFVMYFDSFVNLSLKLFANTITS